MFFRRFITLPVLLVLISATLKSIPDQDSSKSNTFHSFARNFDHLNKFFVEETFKESSEINDSLTNIAFFKAKIDFSACRVPLDLIYQFFYVRGSKEIIYNLRGPPVLFS